MSPSDVLNPISGIQHGATMGPLARVGLFIEGITREGGDGPVPLFEWELRARFAGNNCPIKGASGGLPFLTQWSGTGSFGSVVWVGGTLVDGFEWWARVVPGVNAQRVQPNLRWIVDRGGGSYFVQLGSLVVV